MTLKPKDIPSLFTTLEETLIEEKRCLKIFLLVAETFTE
jgi:hypothetical protein